MCGDSECVRVPDLQLGHQLSLIELREFIFTLKFLLNTVKVGAHVDVEALEVSQKDAVANT